MLTNGKFYSEITKQNYYSEEAMKAEEKAYKEAKAEEEKQEVVLKETREARVKEYYEAFDKLNALKDEYNKKYEEKYVAAMNDLKDFREKLNAEYLEKKQEIVKVIDQFNKDYPSGIYVRYKAGKPSTTIEKVLDSFLGDSFFNSFFTDPFDNRKRIR